MLFNKRATFQILLFFLSISNINSAYADKDLIFIDINEKSGSIELLDKNSIKSYKVKDYKTLDTWRYFYKKHYNNVSYAKSSYIIDCNDKDTVEKVINLYYLTSTSYTPDNSVRFHPASPYESNPITAKNMGRVYKSHGDGTKNPLYSVLNKYVCK